MFSEVSRSRYVIDLDVGVERLDRRASAAVDLRHAERVGECAIWRCRFDSSTMSSSTMPSVPDACRGEVERGGRAEAAGADQQDLRVEQLSWPSSPISGIRRWRL